MGINDNIGKRGLIQQFPGKLVLYEEGAATCRLMKKNLKNPIMPCLKQIFRLSDDTPIKGQLAQIPNAYRKKGYSSWIFPQENTVYSKLRQILDKAGCRTHETQKHPVGTKDPLPEVRHYAEALRLKNYSERTIEAYLPFFRDFVLHFKSRELSQIGVEELRGYVARTIEQQGYNMEHQKQFISAIKFYYEHILGHHKLYFPLHKEIKIDMSDLRVPWEQLHGEINKIQAPGTQLLLLLHYGLGITSAAIAQMTLAGLKEIIQEPIAQKVPYAHTLRQSAIAHYEAANPMQYVFEDKHGNAFPAETLNQGIHRACAQFQLTEIYRAIYQRAARQANHSEQTRKNYASAFLSFLKHYRFRPPATITNDEIKRYLVHLKVKQGLSESHVNNTINALKFYYQQVERRKTEPNLWMRPRRGKKQPEVLSMEEIQQLIATTHNIKHKLMLSLLYAASLRRSELLNLKINDIDTARNVINVRGGKGNKDRQTLLAENLKKHLQEYLKDYQPGEYLFEGQTGGRYSERSIAAVVQQAAKRAGITKHVTPHTLRHSFATHLLENATDIHYIQELPGHNSIKTTARYTHIANTTQNRIQSPLDRLNLPDENNTNNKPP